jgi:hypothetical protein
MHLAFANSINDALPNATDSQARTSSDTYKHVWLLRLNRFATQRNSQKQL